MGAQIEARLASAFWVSSTGAHCVWHSRGRSYGCCGHLLLSPFCIRPLPCGRGLAGISSDACCLGWLSIAAREVCVCAEGDLYGRAGRPVPAALSCFTGARKSAPLKRIAETRICSVHRPTRSEAGVCSTIALCLHAYPMVSLANRFVSAHRHTWTPRRSMRSMTV
jgi:hypothetical protein